MSGPSDEERLRRLDEMLARHRRQEPDSGGADTHTQAQVAWRMVTELVAGLLVGFGIGYGLDAVFGTRPWLLVLFTLLGFAAGVKTMMRTAGELQAPPGKTVARPAAGQEEEGRGG